MIFDCFQFFNELDLLEVRLRILYDYVDHFVIMESTMNHAGQPKPCHYWENRERFAWAADKICYYKCDLKFKYEKDLDVYNGQRTALFEFVRSIAGKEDIIMLSDVDEIPSREFVKSLPEKIEKPIFVKQDLYYYNINCPRNQFWYGTMVLNHDHINCVNDKAGHSLSKTKEANGWHFSYFMSIEQIKDKLLAFGHHKHYGKPPYTDDDHIVKCIRENRNFLKSDRPKLHCEASPIPDYVLAEMQKFPVFMGVYE